VERSATSGSANGDNIWMLQPGRILVIQLQQLGDVLLTAPLIEDLREAYPAATIDFLTKPLAADLVAGNPFVTSIVRYDARRPVGMLRDIRARRYDMVLDFQSNGRSAAIVLSSGASERVGWVKGPRSIVYSLRVPRVQRDEYVVRTRQRMLEHAGIGVRPRLPRIFLSGAERAAGAMVVHALPHRHGARRVAMVLSARAPGSIWPVDRFAAVAQQLASEGHEPVVLPTAGDDDLVSEFQRLVPSARRADFPTLREFVAGLASFDLLICGSTGPSHMGMAVGTPTITLFGADSATTWNAGLDTTVAVTSPRLTCVACAGGASRMAPAHTCMMEISVDEVASRARALLAATRTLSREHGAGE
jgi:ADP-heptose:LPS heptosyltransferase